MTMAIIRCLKRDRFTQIDRRTVNDKTLTFGARGLLLWLVDKPENWQTTTERLAAQSPQGRTAIATILKELEDHGYLVRNYFNDPETGYRKCEWIVYEIPPTTAEQEEYEFPRSRANRSQETRSRSTCAHIDTDSIDTDLNDTEFKSVVASDKSDDDVNANDSEAVRLANLLAERIERNGCKRPTVTKAWVAEIDRIMRIDGRTAAEVEQMIHWAQSDSFWCSNVMSPRSLRKQFDRLLLRSREELEKKRKREPLAGAYAAFQELHDEALAQEEGQ